MFRDVGGDKVMEVSDIINAIDIAEYISQYVDLEEKGGELWG